MATYTYSEAVEQTITAGEQIHQIVNGTATTEVTVEDGSKVPSIRKALLDNFYFKDPIAWQVGQTENVFNQLRKFTDGSWWYAPSATASNPISMGSTPVGNSLWKIYDFDAIGKLTPQIREALRRSYAEVGYNLVDGSFEAGGTLVNANDVLLHKASGKAFSGPAGFVHAGTNPLGGTYTDRSGELLINSVNLLAADLSEKTRNLTYNRIGSGTLIIAHRSGGVGTENSIMNYQKMLESGIYDGIELDMCISADGVLYNFHDRDVSNLTNGVGMFYELNSSYIDTLRYKSTEGTNIAGDPVPRLSDVLRVAADFGCWVSAEIKFLRKNGSSDRLTDVHIMIDALKEAGVFEKSFLGAFDLSYLTAAVNYDKSTSVVRYVYPYTTSGVDEVAALNNSGFSIASIETQEFTKSVSDYIKSKGLIPGVWTPNDPMQQEAAMRSGARIINTDAWGLGAKK